MSTNAAFGTPTLLVHSNRGLPIRTLRYNRETVGDALDERIDRTTYDPIGHAASRIDARFFAASGSPLPNFAYASSLSGQVLRTDSVDAGPQWDLSDVEGRPVWARDGRGTTTTWAHDALGRPLTRAEAVGDESAATRDVWIYGEREANAQEHNLRGQCVRCYDTAGKLAWRAFRLTGQPLNETRWLLADPDIDSNWVGQDDETAWDRALDATAYSTAWGHDATGAWYRQTDAMGNTQQRCVDVAGRLASSRLQPEKGAEQVVLSSVVYSAAGQILSETAGNGMVGSYAYEPQTRRLIGLKVVRPAKTGRATIVQDVSYRYDPVGNVVRVSDAAQAPSYWRKHRTESASVYRYDALYQLIGATGREIAKRGVQGHTVPPATIPLPVDDSVYSNYTRTYTYDRSGNLTTIGHQGTINYKQAIVVSNRSNHAMLQDGAGTLTPDGIDNGKWFDASGNQQQQLPDATQPLGWNNRNALRRVTLIERSGPDNDREAYQYGADGMRVRKCRRTQAKNMTRTVEAIYLPGLTLRVTSNGDGKAMTVSEKIQEIGSEAGFIHMRYLHWEVGQPKGVPGDMARYGSSDVINSIAVELDADADLISREEYYPYGGTAVWAARSQVEADTKFVRYSGKERDAAGLYYYGYRYYQPWVGRWLNADPAGIVDGLNRYRMVHNNPTTLVDGQGLAADKKREAGLELTQEQHARAERNWRRAVGLARRISAGSFKGALSLHSDYYLELLDPMHRYGHALEDQRKLWEKSDSDSNFFEWFKTSVPDEVKSKPEFQGVEYLQDAADRNRHKIIASFSGNTVRPSEDFPLDQKSGILRAAPHPEAIFIMDRDNEIYMMHKEKYKRQHTSLMAGAPVRSAGMIVMNQDFEIVSVEAHSGHYRPQASHLAIFLETLRGRGADLSKIVAIHTDSNRQRIQENAHTFVQAYDRRLLDAAAH